MLYSFITGNACKVSKTHSLTCGTTHGRKKKREVVMSLRIYVDEKIVKNFNTCATGDSYRVLELVGLLHINVEGFYFEFGYGLSETLQITPEIIPFIIGFSFKTTAALPNDRRQGVYTSGGIILTLMELFNSQYNFSISCQTAGGVESYAKMYKLYCDVCAGRCWPDSDKDFTAKQCATPVLQVRYHLHQAVRIILDRAKAWFRQIFRRK